MKKTIFFIALYFLFGLTQLGQCQIINKEIVEVITKIEAVKIHIQGAEETRLGKLKINAGRSNVILKNLSSKIYETSGATLEAETGILSWSII